MTDGFYYAILISWLLSFLFYGLAGGLIKARTVGRTPHIMLTVGGFMTDFVAYFFQTQHLVILAATVPGFALDPALRGWQTVATNLSMAMYCVTAMFGFARVVGWHGVGRWHVPVALLFVVNLVTARTLYWRLIN
ncbi:MAG: hypothetical protein HZA24_01705 [Nitrospirae bacterium]|nr:hypothetical protein [Nitrospirota bacterium]